MAESRRTHYDVLGLRPTASTAAVRNAYLNLARLVHPDRHQHSTSPERALAERRMREITAAWAVLGDAASRERYDREITATRPTEPSGGTDDEPRRFGHRTDDGEEVEEGVEVSRAVYHLLTKGPLFALIALAVLILVFTAYARPSASDPTVPGPTTWTTAEVGPDR